MLEAFEEYISEYSLDQSYMKLKHDHSIRVMELMGKYAKELNYSDDDIELAKLIGLLHDIGRFEQYKVFGSDKDHETVDHADYSVVQLFDKNQIVQFTDRQEWYPIIEFAIKNHNKRYIPYTEDERVLKFAKLIRDIDKLDIVYLLGYLGQHLYEDVKADITSDVRNYVIKHETVDVTKCANDNDWTTAQFAFVFDINNNIILKEYKENLSYLFDRVNKDRFKEIYEETIKYIDERID
jgi:putative nucleotidyltransferase with HDIG domain